MMLARRLFRNDDGTAAIEAAFALPILIVLVWMFVQFAQVYRAMAGIQQALGEGARFATLCRDPDQDGCSVPRRDDIDDKMMASVYGIGPGDFHPDTSILQSEGTTGNYYDLTVTYTQPTSLLLFPGPTINVTRSKKVWVAGSSEEAA